MNIVSEKWRKFYTDISVELFEVRHGHRVFRCGILKRLSQIFCHFCNRVKLFHRWSRFFFLFLDRVYLDFYLLRLNNLFNSATWKLLFWLIILGFRTAFDFLGLFHGFVDSPIILLVFREILLLFLKLLWVDLFQFRGHFFIVLRFSLLGLNLFFITFGGLFLIFGLLLTLIFLILSGLFFSCLIC